jgi:hypothetical protein
MQLHKQRWPIERQTYSASNARRIKRKAHQKLGGFFALINPLINVRFEQRQSQSRARLVVNCSVKGGALTMTDGFDRMPSVNVV